MEEFFLAERIFMKNKLSGFFLPNADVASFFCLVDSLAGYNFASIKCFSSGTMNITLVYLLAWSVG